METEYESEYGEEYESEYRAEYHDFCPKCGMKRKDMLEKGIFGCAFCFELFADDAKKILEEVQGVSKYEDNFNASSEEEMTKTMDSGEIFDREYDDIFNDNFNENAEAEQDNKAESEDYLPECENDSTNVITNTKKIIELTEQMEKAAKTEDFDLAALLRDRINELIYKKDGEEQ